MLLKNFKIRGSAVVELAVIFPILMLLICLLVEIHRLLSVKQVVYNLAYECGRDFSVSGNTSSFQDKINKFGNIISVSDDKLSYYVHLFKNTDSIKHGQLFFDTNGSGVFDSSDIEISLNKGDSQTNPDVSIGSKTAVFFNKKFNIQDDKNISFDDNSAKVGYIVFVYKFSFFLKILNKVLFASKLTKDGDILITGVSIVCREN